MKAEEVYRGRDYFDDYQPMLEAFGQILVQRDEDGYQGDSWILLYEGKRYGFLNFGWGSCCGCDALQACNNIEEVQELMDQLEESIIWFDNRNDVLNYFITTDWKGKYSWGLPEFKIFITQVINYLGKSFYKEHKEGR